MDRIILCMTKNITNREPKKMQRQLNMQIKHKK